jgi:hypothetical protein
MSQKKTDTIMAGHVKSFPFSLKRLIQIIGDADDARRTHTTEINKNRTTKAAHPSWSIMSIC